MHQATHENLHQGNFGQQQTLGDAQPPLADRHLPHVPVRLRTAANSSPVIAGISEDNPARRALMQCTVQIGSAMRQETGPSICQSKSADPGPIDSRAPTGRRRRSGPGLPSM